MSHRRACNCCYVAATLCSGQETSDAPPLVVHIDHLPVSPTVFKYRTWCYTIDPAGDRIQWPVGSVRVTPGQTYSDCAECVADEEEPDPPPVVTPPGGGWDDGANGPWSGGGIGNGPGGGGGSGFRATLCPGQDYTDDTPDVYAVKANAEVPDGSFIFRYGAWCYSVTITTGEQETIPGGAQAVVIDTSYASCAECIGGLPATICGNQRFRADTPRVWIRSDDLPTSPRWFRHNNVCYYVNPAQPTQPIPPNADIIRARAQYASCEACVQGVLATLCFEELQSEGASESPPVVWVPVDALPASTAVFKYRGWCLSIDPAGTQVVKPQDAVILYPEPDYVDCEACYCGSRLKPRGVQAKICGGQADSARAEDLWLSEANLPASRLHFKHNGLCYTVNPDDDLRDVPPGAALIKPASAYDSCSECVADRVTTPVTLTDPPDPEDPPDPGAGDPPPVGPSNDPPPAPPPGGGELGPGGGYPPTPPDPPPGGYDWDSYQLKRCSDGVLTGQYVQAFFDANHKQPTGVHQGYVAIDGICYQVTRIKGSGGTIYTGPIYNTCVNCAAHYKWIPLRLCSDGSLTTKYVKVWDWINLWTGKILKSGGVCYVVNAGDTTVDTEPEDVVAVSTAHTDCSDCDGSPPTCPPDESMTAYAINFPAFLDSDWSDGDYGWDAQVVIVTKDIYGDYVGTIHMWYDDGETAFYFDGNVRLYRQSSEFPVQCSGEDSNRTCGWFIDVYGGGTWRAARIGGGTAEGSYTCDWGGLFVPGITIPPGVP